MQGIGVCRLALNFQPMAAGGYYAASGTLQHKAFSGQEFGTFQTALWDGRLREASRLFNEMRPPVYPQQLASSYATPSLSADGTVRMSFSNVRGTTTPFDLASCTTIGAILHGAEHLSGTLKMYRSEDMEPSFSYDQYFRTEWGVHQMVPIGRILASHERLNLVPDGDLDRALAASERWGVYVAGGVLTFSTKAHGDVVAMRRSAAGHELSPDDYLVTSVAPKPADPPGDHRVAVSQSEPDFTLAVLVATLYGNEKALFRDRDPQDIRTDFDVPDLRELRLQNVLGIGAWMDTHVFRQAVLDGAYGRGFAADHAGDARTSARKFRRLYRLAQDGDRRTLARAYQNATGGRLAVFDKEPGIE